MDVCRKNTTPRIFPEMWIAQPSRYGGRDPDVVYVGDVCSVAPSGPKARPMHPFLLDIHTRSKNTLPAGRCALGNIWVGHGAAAGVLALRYLVELLAGDENGGTCFEAGSLVRSLDPVGNGDGVTLRRVGVPEDCPATRCWGSQPPTG